MSLQILETPRLVLREFNLEDTSFIVTLLNSPGWLKYIGDRNVKNENDARRYLAEGPMASYAKNGFGLWGVQRKNDGVLIGMCGLLKRDSLETVDIGFAFLPEFCGSGFAMEISSATLSWASSSLGLNEIMAITTMSNFSSTKLLMKLGFSFLRTQLINGEKLLVFRSRFNQEKHSELDVLTTTFYQVFSNKTTPDVDALRKIFYKNGSLIKNINGKPEHCFFDEFIDNRKGIFKSGELTNFNEYELSARNECCGNIAQRFSVFVRNGELNGRAFQTVGVKCIQFIKLADEWKINSITWDEESHES